MSESREESIPNTKTGTIEIGIATSNVAEETPRVFIRASEGNAIFIFSLDEAVDVAKKILSAALSARKLPATPAVSKFL